MNIGNILGNVIDEMSIVVLSRRKGKSTLLQNEVSFSNWQYLPFIGFNVYEMTQDLLQCFFIRDLVYKLSYYKIKLIFEEGGTI